MLKKLLSQEEKISVIGLGYVGLPLAVAFAEKGIDVIGFDLNKEKIEKYRRGEDPTNEVGKERLSKLVNLKYTCIENDLKEARFHIVAVPTPVGKNHIPDLNPVKVASEVVGRNLKSGSYVIFESTVYPGVTEEICLPILEKESGLKCGVDFKIGYSPERINPGDKVNTLEKIIKITSGMDEESSETIAQIYALIIKAGIHKVNSIKVAEAAKVIENSQRDVNIAFVNELSMIFERMGIDTLEVLEAAETKWNFLPFRPGLVGGHCIGVDPYYLTYKSEEMGHFSQLIVSGRRINDGMSKFIAEKCIKGLIATGRKVKGSKILIMGLTFKENCPDLRNSKVADVIKELREYGIEIIVTDPHAEALDAKNIYGLVLSNADEIENIDGMILAVKHREYENLDLNEIKKLFNSEIEKPLLLDLKGYLSRQDAEKYFSYWRM